MTLNSTENSSDYSIDDSYLDDESIDAIDPYITSLIVEMQNYETPEDIGFQDYINVFPSKTLHF